MNPKPHTDPEDRLKELFRGMEPEKAPSGFAQRTMHRIMVTPLEPIAPAPALLPRWVWMLVFMATALCCATLLLAPGVPAAPFDTARLYTAITPWLWSAAALTSALLLIDQGLKKRTATP